MEKTREMFNLGQVVFLEGIKKLKEYKTERLNFIHKRRELIIKKRLAVVELTHGLELILKAILIRKGYCIYKVRGGIHKINSQINDIIDTNRTIELDNVIKFFTKEYPNLPFDNINKLRSLRNQIIHKGTQIDEKKREYFIGAINCLAGIYTAENIKHKTFLKEIKNAKLNI